MGYVKGNKKKIMQPCGMAQNFVAITNSETNDFFNMTRKEVQMQATCHLQIFHTTFL